MLVDILDFRAIFVLLFYFLRKKGTSLLEAELAAHTVGYLEKMSVMGKVAGNAQKAANRVSITTESSQNKALWSGEEVKTVD